MTSAAWDERIARAQELAASQPFAAEGLRFYERIAGFQRTLYLRVEAELGKDKEPRPPGSLREELDLFLLLPAFPSFLALVEAAAPGPLSQAAVELAARGAARWQEVLHEFWRSGAGGDTDVDAGSAAELDAPDALISWTFLQPYAEYLADHTEQPADGSTPDLCPCCGGRPQVGVLRPRGDGGKRSLICALCATEWEYRRIVCHACGEESVDKLPVYVAEELGHVRVEACDTCGHYIKTIDLTKNGRAVPVVDELAAVPLSLWAEEHGYAKLRTNLMGI
jgi:FdhE protein